MKQTDKIHEIFHENSKLRSLDYDFFSWIQHVNSSYDIRNIISNPNYKFIGYEKFPLDISLENISKEEINFFETVVNRKSTRYFAGNQIDFKDLSKLLFCANGVTRIEKYEDGTIWKLRTVPSGGGVFPVEIICAISGVEGLVSGLYFFNPIENCITLLSTIAKNEIDQEIINSMPALESTIKMSSVNIFLISNLPRIEFKYRSRGYRFSLLECGHIAQNIALAAESLNLGSLCIGGFLDDEINDFLKLDGIDRAVQYCISIGSK
jgi:SagB-type dehydrogenase family enzyme